MTPEQARTAIDPRRLAIARDLLSRRAEGWSEERIEARKQQLLAQLEKLQNNPTHP